MTDRIDVWISVFIPNEHPGNPDYIKTLKGGKTAVPAPPFPLLTPLTQAVIPSRVLKWFEDHGQVWGSGVVRGLAATSYFLTDQRGFSSDRNASARLHFAVTFVIDEDSVEIVPAKDQSYFWCDPSHQVSSAGELIATATSDPDLKLFFAKGSWIGELRRQADNALLFVRGSAGNPLAPVPEAVTPALDFSGIISLHLPTRSIGFKGMVGQFPATEAYASLNGGPPATLFRSGPAAGSTIWDLPDFDLGVNMQSVDGEATLKDAAAGSGKPPGGAVAERHIARSMFVANVLSMPKNEAIDAALVTGLIDRAARLGADEASLSRIAGTARAALGAQSASFAEVGLNLGLDRVTLLQRKAEALLLDPGLEGNGFLDELDVQRRRWDAVSAGLTTMVAEETGAAEADRFLSLVLEQAGLRAQEDVALADSMNMLVFNDLAIAINDPASLAAQALERATGDAIAGALGQTLAGIVDEPGLLLGEQAFAAVSGNIEKATSALSETFERSFRAIEEQGGIEGAIEDLVLRQLSEKTGLDVRRMADAVAAIETDQLSLSSASSGLYLASVVGGLIDPALGRDIQRFGSAALTIYETVNAFAGSASGGSALFGVGMAALSGNYVGAVMSLAGMGGSSGPDPYVAQQLQLILKEVQALRVDVQNLSKRMEDRFNRVDRALVAIHGDLNAGLDRVEQRLSGIAVDVRAIRSSLTTLNSRLDSMQAALTNGQRELLDQMEQLAVGAFLRWAQDITTPLPRDDFLDCASKLVQFATETAATNLKGGPATWNPADPAVSAALLSPHEHVRTFVAAAEALGRPLAGTGEPATMPGLSAWSTAAAEYARFLEEWPDYAQYIRPSQFKRLVEAGERVQAPLIASGDLDGPDAILPFLFKRYGEIVDRVASKVEQASDSLMGDGIAPLEGTRLVSSNWGPQPLAMDLPLAMPAIPSVTRAAERDGFGKLRYFLGKPEYDLPDHVDRVGPHAAPLRSSFRVEMTAAGQTVTILEARVTYDAKLNVNITSFTDSSISYIQPTDDVGELVKPELSKLAALLMKIEAPRFALPRSAGEADPSAEAVQSETGQVLSPPTDASPDTTFSLADDDLTVVGKFHDYAQLTEDLAQYLRPNLLAAIIDTPVAEVDEFDLLSGLIRGFVQLGFAQEIRGNDLLLALTQGEAALPDRKWLSELLGQSGDLGQVRSIALKRAAALSRLIRAAAQARQNAAVPSGDPIVREIQSHVTSVERLLAP